MGEDILREKNFEFEIIAHPIFDNLDNDTNANHTIVSANIMKNIEELKIIIFVGGDGTARDIFTAVGKKKACLGIPAGVKIYSSVFAINTISASEILIKFLLDEIPLMEAEVLDIDENKYREGQLFSKLYGHLIIPYLENYNQYAKTGSPLSDLNNQQRIAKRIIEELEHDTYYLLCPGTTIKAIADGLNLHKTILGIDLLLNNEIIAYDLNEYQILERIKNKKVKIICSITGGQGFLFGRGNLQISPKVIKAVNMKNIIILSTRIKLLNIKDQVLKLDTRDLDLDREMRGLYRVLVDYDEYKICNVK
jgi:predicted polyphosphate/ATP-dependent NAD kinase